MPFAAWKQVAARTWTSLGRDNISLAAAGVAFYGFVALVPMLAAVVLGYGLVAEPGTVIQDMQKMMSVMPADAAKLIAEQLLSVIHTSSTKKGFGLIVALVLALYGARNGASAIITGLDIAYEEQEDRSFVRLVLLSLAITVGGILVAIVAMVAVAALGHLDDAFSNAPQFVIVAGKLISYVALVLAGASGAATLYRFGPDRKKAKWVWITPGSLIAALLWLLLTIGFGLYVADFGNYNATYGSLGAVVVFLTWLYLSAYVLLLGAEINAELERQTTADTTVGPPMPIGQRGASVADQVAAPKSVPATDRLSGSASPKSDLATAGIVSRGAPFLGLERTGKLPAIVTTIGLAALRREGRSGLGIILLAVGGALAWSGRETRPDA
jgi:membrane protein